MMVYCPRCGDDRSASHGAFELSCPTCDSVSKLLRVDDPDKQAEVTVAKAIKTTVKSPSEVKTVLVVDDSKFFRELIFDILQPLQLQLLGANNGVEALETILTRNPDLVLLDLNLPKKNGYEVIREVRSNPAVKDICLLAMSGVYHKEVDAAKARRVGANDFIKKSFKPGDLQKFIKMWLMW